MAEDMSEPRLYITAEAKDGKGQVVLHRVTPSGKLVKVSTMTKQEALRLAADVLNKALQITEY